MHGRTYLVDMVGFFDSYKYRKIVDNYLFPFQYNTHYSLTYFVLQDHNCDPYRAGSFAANLQNKETRRMKWSARSYDLNNLEDVRRLITAQLFQRSEYHRNTVHLFPIPNVILSTPYDAYFEILVATIPKRVRSVRVQQGRRGIILFAPS